MAARQKVLVARRIFPDIVARLSEQFEVEEPLDDTPLPQPELIRRLAGKAGLFATGTELIDATLLAACPDLRAVCLMTVGHNNVDLAACSAHGVRVTNAPDVLTETTADFGFGLMLAAARRITEAEHYLRAGRWGQWSIDLLAGADVHGSTLGILGMGRIGQAIARRGAFGFGMQVIYHNRSRLAPELEAPLGAQWVAKDELLRRADHLILVVPYSPQAHHLIGAEELALMKPSATLTNIARGGVVDDAALAEALAAGRLAAAGLDVFEGEPALNPALLALSNVVLTPHIASASLPTRRAMCNLAVDNLIALLSGAEPLTPLNLKD
ncbi:2-hydroxyacid dehydrogenase [Roseateles oligotrophus]|uniref:D-glycerate dehydrogenase n=1 Tax=Roseateles oligotrophus TaxID=1769250 RepID=A0ABT2YJ50_9BURK|nr:D-glycerate dehydrogenase [Roseateles oligotrophus]MCV2370100.1 D-glycerate dehydrogenase [Roseateles oligotrophus]